jgi:hypothetical protein
MLTRRHFIDLTIALLLAGPAVAQSKTATVTLTIEGMT